MTVLVYVDTSKQVGDRDHLKIFDSQEGVAFEYEVNSMMTTREAHDRFSTGGGSYSMI